MASALDKRDMLGLIWRNIDEKMIEMGMSRLSLAQRARVAPALITRIKYRRANPTLETLEKIARALDVSLGDLCSPNGVTR